MSRRDLYRLLGLHPGASHDEVRSAYRDAARRFHPDANPNPGATQAFKDIAEAYVVLGDPTQRRAYDEAPPPSPPALIVSTSYSRASLPALGEPQVVYVLLDITPAPQVEAAAPAVNLCLVVDRSTSMQGPRLEHVRAAVLQVIDSLGEDDSYAVVAFSDRPEVVVPAQHGLAGKTIAKARVSTLSASGGTEILQGLLRGLIELHRYHDVSAVNHLLLLTDGRTYGDEADCLLLASLAAGDGITISGMGIGEEWNDVFLDEVTARTGGTAAYIQNTGQISGFLQDRVRGLERVRASGLCLSLTRDPGVELITAFKVAPEPSPLGAGDQLRLGNLGLDEAARVLLKFRLPPVTPGEAYLARVEATAAVHGDAQRRALQVADLACPVVTSAPPPAPPPQLQDALTVLAQYQMEERIWQQVGAGDIAGGVERLKALGTRLMASGHGGLARLALGGAADLQQSRHLAEEVRKGLKYGTRALIAAKSREAP